MAQHLKTPLGSPLSFEKHTSPPNPGRGKTSPGAAKFGPCRSDWDLRVPGPRGEGLGAGGGELRGLGEGRLRGPPAGHRGAAGGTPSSRSSGAEKIEKKRNGGRDIGGGRSGRARARVLSVWKVGLLMLRGARVKKNNNRPLAAKKSPPKRGAMGKEEHGPVTRLDG